MVNLPIANFIRNAQESVRVVGSTDDKK